MELRINEHGNEFLQLTINNVAFTYRDMSFRCFDYQMTTRSGYRRTKEIDFFKAQLAFRGFSPRGNDIHVLRDRLQNVYANEMDVTVKQGMSAMAKAWADVVPELVKSNQALRQMSQSTAQRKSELAASQRAESLARQRSESLAKAKQSALERKWANRTIDRRLAENDPERFLREMFLDDEGNDEGGPPIELTSLSPSDRFVLHDAARHFGLFHVTSVTNVMVIGSSRNRLGEDRLDAINRANGWPPKLYRPNISRYHSQQEDEQGDDESWDITGSWELECPSMAANFFQSEPYTLDISRYDNHHGAQFCGECDFGEFKGVIRFSTREMNDDSRPYEDTARYDDDEYDDDEYDDDEYDDDEYLIKDGEPVSAARPKFWYKWRGKDGQDIIQLGSDNHWYNMTFSHGGRRVKGTWGTHRCDPGDVEFTGVKIGGSGHQSGAGVLARWSNHNQAAYDKANRDRWRR